MIANKFDAFMEVTIKSRVFKTLTFGELLLWAPVTAIVMLLVLPFYMASAVWNDTGHKCKK